MRIAICDDEKKFISDFTFIVKKLYNNLDIIIDEFSDGSQLLRRFAIQHYDVVFLDIEMPELNGISLAKMLRGLSETVYIVFLTGHIEYALKGYEVNALRYLTKPVREESVREVIDHIIRKQNERNFFWEKTSDGEYKIRLSDIVFIEAQDQKSIIRTISKNFEVRKKINYYEKQLTSEGFFRIHRSYIVSISKINSISGRNVTVIDGSVLPVGRTYESKFRNALMAFVNKEAF